MEETLKAWDYASTNSEVVVQDLCTLSTHLPTVIRLLIMSVQAPTASPTGGHPPTTPPRQSRSQKPLVNHLNNWLKANERQDAACIAQSMLDHVTEVERNKAVRLAREEDVYANGFLDGAELEAFKNNMEQDVEELFQSSQDSLNLESNVYPSSSLSALPPSLKKKVVK